MKTWIVLPTYNEVDNLEVLIRAIRAVVDVQLLVVDDNSPDGTGDLVDRLAVTDQDLHVLHRTGKLGLGSAYQEGFRFALDHRADMVIQMDADGSHDPALLPTMIARLHDTDLVIASRYIPGGSFSIAWHRRWISTAGNTYIRLLLGLGIHDWSTGYKAWRGSFLQQVMEQPMRGVGYAWLMEMTWWARRLHGRIAEVPLKFRERQAGRSKFNWRIAVEDIRLAWALHRR